MGILTLHLALSVYYFSVSASVVYLMYIKNLASWGLFNKNYIKKECDTVTSLFLGYYDSGLPEAFLSYKILEPSAGISV